jgi:hypothetical protein
MMHEMMRGIMCNAATMLVFTTQHLRNIMNPMSKPQWQCHATYVVFVFSSLWGRSGSLALEARRFGFDAKHYFDQGYAVLQRPVLSAAELQEAGDVWQHEWEVCILAGWCQ